MQSSGLCEVGSAGPVRIGERLDQYSAYARSFIAVRSEAASPEHPSRSVAAALARVDPDVRVSFLTGTGIVNFALARDRLVARLAAFAGLLGLLLTALGLGGVTYQVTRLRSELPVRFALGSTRQAAGRARSLARAAKPGRGCGRRSGIQPVDVVDGGIDAIRRRALGPGRLRRCGRHAHGCRSPRWLRYRRRASRLSPARALTITWTRPYGVVQALHPAGRRACAPRTERGPLPQADLPWSMSLGAT